MKDNVSMKDDVSVSTCGGHHAAQITEVREDKTAFGT
jgi:hypothetical protein